MGVIGVGLQVVAWINECGYLWPCGAWAERACTLISRAVGRACKRRTGGYTELLPGRVKGVRPSEPQAPPTKALTSVPGCGWEGYLRSHSMPTFCPVASTSSGRLKPPCGRMGHETQATAVGRARHGGSSTSGSTLCSQLAGWLANVCNRPAALILQQKGGKGAAVDGMRRLS